MGKVYRVEDKKTKEELALKLIKPEISSDKKTIERFSNELKMAHKISHRNVSRMYHLGEEKGTHYITMEYVRGEDLKSMIRMSRQLSAGTAINITKQIGEELGVDYALEGTVLWDRRVEGKSRVRVTPLTCPHLLFHL